MFGVRTDLALEARELYMQEAGEEVPGVEIENAGDESIKITRVKVTDEQGEKAIGKKRGNYITLEMPGMSENNAGFSESCALALADELARLVQGGENTVTLVVGLGNSKITPDSLGPRTVSNLLVTRHLFSHVEGFDGEGLASVCALAPGVLGITGMETGEVIRGVAEKIKPDMIIAVDALASRSIDRLNKTVQIADTGINPGSGVGNHRQAISFETLGVPVIAIGVPMVIDAATVANDTIDKVIDSIVNRNCQSPVCDTFRNIDREEKHRLIREVVPAGAGGLMVTSTDIDSVAHRVSKVVANGINLCLHKGITLQEINGFLV